MLKRFRLVSLFVIAAVTAYATVVGAATCPSGYTYKCPIIGGTRCCSCWKTGSEVCDTEVTGLGNIKNCIPGVNCPVVTCSVYGTADLGDGSCNPNTLDPDCGIQGIAYCVNPAGNASKAQGNPFTLETVLSGSANIDKCDKNGKCTRSIEINPEDCPDCCINPKWQFKTFTATKFNGEVCVCPGGYSTEGECCNDIERLLDGSCATAGEEVCLVQQCTANLTGYKPGRSIPYDCTDLPQ